MRLEQLQELVAEGESERLEFKKSTGELRGGTGHSIRSKKFRLNLRHLPQNGQFGMS